MIRVNGYEYDYEPGDLWCVEVGRGPRGAYKPRYTLDLLYKAVGWYNGINIGLGYKKRLVLERATGERITIIKAAS